ncbi:SPT20 [Candida margitis]|uniref:SPT20 n=1 Tax=Candida margitis TaxID=1775924 RepID=UPI002226BB5B|nr:SPT20 [Candida margitis]KAI5969154.1 SPT20 [Candida margitis]
MTNSEVSNGSGPTLTANRGAPHSNQIHAVQSQHQHQHQQQHQQQQQQQSLKQKIGLRNYHFASTSEEILRKYTKYPASLSLHIFDNHYRFNNSQDSQIIPKTSPMIKTFMSHVLKEEIPVELSELLKDFSIKSYDGCLILQVYDHRNMIKTSTYRANASPSKDAKQSPAIVSKPRTYRILLKPTPLSLYYDLLYHTDSALTKFTDTLSLQMESEILALTNRELDLSVKVNPYQYDYLKPDTNEMGKQEMGYPHRAGVNVPPRKIHQDELVLHKSSEYEELMLLLSNTTRRFEDTQDKKLVVVPQTMPSTSSTSSIATPPTKSGSKESSVGAESKAKKGDKGPSSSAISASVAISSNPVRTTGQFMRLRLIEEIRKKREIEKNQQEAKIHAQANSVQNDMVPSSGTAPLPPDPSVATANSLSHPLTEAQIGDKRQQQMLQQTGKRARKDTKQSPASGPIMRAAGPTVPQGLSGSQIPFIPSNPNSQMSSMNNTPLMGNQGVPQQPNISQAPTPQQIPRGPPNMGQAVLPQQNPSQPQSAVGPQNMQQSPPPHLQRAPNQPSLQQQQHQQIFQGSLTPEEQQVYKQIQQKMNALAMMSQTGVAPNGQQLTPQHKQQAMQQVKVLQQQLLQKFPVYFQRLKQFQLYQKQKQLQQQRASATGGSGSPNLNGQYSNNMMQSQQSAQQQHFANQLSQGAVPSIANPQPLNSGVTAQPAVAEPKKKRVYKKKAAK